MTTNRRFRLVGGRARARRKLKRARVLRGETLENRSLLAVDLLYGGTGTPLNLVDSAGSNDTMSVIASPDNVGYLRVDLGLAVFGAASTPAASGLIYSDPFQDPTMSTWADIDVSSAGAITTLTAGMGFGDDTITLNFASPNVGDLLINGDSDTDTIIVGPALTIGGSAITLTADAITMSGTVSAAVGGSLFVDGPTTLSAALTVNVDNVTFTSTLDGGADLTLNGAGFATFQGPVGSLTPIGDNANDDAITINAGSTEFWWSVSTLGNFVEQDAAFQVAFEDDVTVDGDLTLLSNVVSQFFFAPKTWLVSGDVLVGNDSADSFQVFDGPRIINAMGNVTLNATTTLNYDGSLEVDAVNITVNGTIDSVNTADFEQVALNATALVDINADIGSSGPVATLTISGATVDIDANLATEAGLMSISGSTLVDVAAGFTLKTTSTVGGVTSGDVVITGTSTGSILIQGSIVTTGASLGGPGDDGGLVTITTNDGPISVFNITTSGGNGGASPGGNAGTVYIQSGDAGAPDSHDVTLTGIIVGLGGSGVPGGAGALVTVDADGRIVDAHGGTDIVSESAELLANEGIGAGAGEDNQLEINVTTLAAETVVGPLRILDSFGGVTVGTAGATTGVKILTGPAQPLVLRAFNTAGSITVNEAVSNASGGSLTLASEGATAAHDLTINSSVSATGGTGAISLYAGDSISVTAVGSVAASSTGNVLLYAGANYNNGAPSNGTTTGDITITSGGTVSSAAGDVTLLARRDVFVSGVTAGNQVSITADDAGPSGGATDFVGAIIDNDGLLVNVTAPSLQMRAASGIGSGDALETAVGTLAALNNTSGNIEVDNATGALLTVGTLAPVTGIQHTGTGNIILTHDAGLDVNDPVKAFNGNVTVAAGGALHVNDLVEAAGGANTVTMSSGAAFNVNALNALGIGHIKAAGLVTLTAVDSSGTGNDLTIFGLGTTANSAVVESTGGNIDLNAGDIATVQAFANVLVNPTAALLRKITITVDAAGVDPDPGVGGQVYIEGNANIVANTNPASPNAAPGGWFTNGGTYLVGGNDADGDFFKVHPLTTTRFAVEGNDPTTFPGDELFVDLLNPSVPTPTLTIGGVGSGAWSFSGGYAPIHYKEIEHVDANAPYHLVIDSNFPGSFGNTGIEDDILIRRDVTGLDLVVERTGVLGPSPDDVGILYQGTIANVLSLTYLGSTDVDVVTIDDVYGLPAFSSSVPGVTNNPLVAGTPSFLFNGGGGSALNTLVYNLNQPGISQVYGIGDGLGGGAGSSATLPAGEVRTVTAAFTLVAYVQDVDAIQTVTATPASFTTPLQILGDPAANTMTIAAAPGVFTRMTATQAGNLYPTFAWENDSFPSLQLSGLGGNDTLDLVSLNAGETSFPVTLLGGDNDDTIRVQTTTAGSTVTMLGGNGADALQVYTIAGATAFPGDTTDGIASQIIADGELGVDSLTIRNSGSTSATANFVEATDFTVDGINNNFAGPDVTHTNVETLDVTSSKNDDQFRIEFTAMTAVLNATFRGYDGIDLFGGMPPFPGPPAQPIPDLKPSVKTSIFIFGGNPGPSLPYALYGNDPNGDRLYIDMSAVNAPVVVDTVGGVAKSINPVPSHKPVSFKEIEFIQLRDNVIVGGVPTPGTVVPGVIRGDLYFRGTSGIDKVDFQHGSIVNAFDPTEVQILLGTARNGPYYPTHRIVAYGRQGDDQITINGSLNSNPNLQGADLYGETGNDYLAGNLRNDSFYGGDGNDKLLLDGGDNYGDGGAGNDSISGGAGKDVIYGCAGLDSLFGGGGDDTIYGGADRDLIQGADGNDIIRGEAGDDSLSGGNGSDVLIAGDGNDTLNGEAGRDFLIGGNGADTLYGGADDDIVVAGRTSYDAAGMANDQAVLAIMAEWNSGSTVAVRRTNIRAGVGSPLAWLEFNAGPMKNVFDDSPAAKDTINTANPGQDWIMAGNGNGTTTKDKVSVATGHIVDYYS